MKYIMEESIPILTDRKRQKPARRLTKKIIFVIFIMFILFIVGASNYLNNKNISPIKVFTGQLQFTLYYPTPLPEGVIYTEGSANITHGVLFYQLQTPKGAITISQQASPKQLQNYKIDGFNEVATPNGTMLLGSAQNSPTAILTTADSLINIKGTSASSLLEVSNIGQSLRKVL